MRPTKLLLVLACSFHSFMVIGQRRDPECANKAANKAKNETEEQVYKTFFSFIEDPSKPNSYNPDRVNKKCLSDVTRIQYLLMKAAYSCYHEDNLTDTEKHLDNLNTILKGYEFTKPARVKAFKPKFDEDRFFFTVSSVRKDIIDCLVDKEKSRAVAATKRKNEGKTSKKMIEVNSLVEHYKNNGLLGSFPVDECRSPDIRCHPIQEKDAIAFVLDVYSCDKMIEYEDRMEIGQIGFPTFYADFIGFFYKKIIVPHIDSTQKSWEEVKSNINITIEGHTDSLAAGTLVYDANTFHVPKGTKYLYKELHFNSEKRSVSKTLNTDLTNQVKGNTQLGLARAGVAGAVIDSFSITSNPISLISINHLDGSEYRYRKVRIIIQLNEYFGLDDINNVSGLLEEKYANTHVIQFRYVRKGRTIIKKRFSSPK